MYERVLSLDPVLNELTVYSTVMSCSEGRTRVSYVIVQGLLSV